MTPASFLQCGGHRLDLTRPRVMGVVNATPDSFSDGGRYLDPAQAIAHARQLVADGADIVDVGGESTRPGADEVSAAAECARVLPVVRALALDGAIVSVDTSKPEVIRAAVDAGASMINDVRALRVAGALDAAAASGAAVCLMHMKGDPRTMQQAPQYADVVADVREFLAERIDAARAAGIPAERIAVDPGFGFGKTLEHNVAVMRGLPALAALGYPVVVGYSRKSSLGAITGRGPHDRLAASLAAALVAIARGARIVRVHDVRETVDALAVWTLMQAQ
ncbi:MAG TPA: dihydropteroate synthase [Casimicrobiaceae bacterium]|jgi:dihydropteroate synthase|nr:dihydropteroate synthase [Casimicrobiaceae bacterium]